MTQVARAIPLSLIVLLLLVHSPAWSQDHPSPHDHAGMSMSKSEPLDPEMQAKLLSWKLESESNHHVAGFLVVLAGLFILAEGVLKNGFPIVRYAWPVCFVLAGLFVLVYSDTELWPFGYKPWIQGVITNPEVIQHKVFAVMLLGLGSIEMARVRGRLNVAWAAWVFPALAVAGSILLLFHAHDDSGMQGAEQMASMEHIQAEHLGYAVTGVGIGVAKGLAEAGTRWRRVFSKLWPALLIVLGILLTLYTE